MCVEECAFHYFQSAESDPGFPERGREQLIWPFFSENCMKIGPRGGEARPKFYYVDLPLIGNVSGIDTQKIRRKNSMFFKWKACLCVCAHFKKSFTEGNCIFVTSLSTFSKGENRNLLMNLLHNLFRVQFNGTAERSTMKSNQQECIPVGCVSPALYCTGGSLSRGLSVQGFSVQGTLCPGDPLHREPWKEHGTKEGT